MNGKERNGDDVHIEVATGGTGREQKTIGKSVVAYGVGNHSGVYTGMILLPMPPDTGILFEHIPDGERIPATVDHVYSLGFASCLKGPRCTVQTVEHLLAACHMYGLTNLLIKVSKRYPCSTARPAISARRSKKRVVVGRTQSGAPDHRREDWPRQPAAGKVPFHRACRELEIDYTLDYPLPTIGRQRYFFKGGKESFLTNIAPARTFGTIDDFEKLAKTGVGSGGRISNVPCKAWSFVDSEKVINTKLRFDDEFARHKVLDLMGDMYLIGRPIVGRVVAERTGHMENIALVKEIKRRARRRPTPS